MKNRKLESTKDRSSKINIPLKEYENKVNEELIEVINLSIEILIFFVFAIMYKRISTLRTKLNELKNFFPSLKIINNKKEVDITALLNQLLGFSKAERALLIINKDDECKIYEQTLPGHKLVAKEYKKIVDKYIQSFIDSLNKQDIKLCKHDFEYPDNFTYFLHPMVKFQVNFAVIFSISILLKVGVLELHYCSNTNAQKQRFEELEFQQFQSSSYIFKLNNL